MEKWGVVIEEYDGRKLSTAEGRALASMKDVFKKVQKMYTDALQGANGNFEALGIYETSDGIGRSVKEQDIIFIRHNDLETESDRQQLPFTAATIKDAIWQYMSLISLRVCSRHRITLHKDKSFAYAKNPLTATTS